MKGAFGVAETPATPASRAVKSGRSRSREIEDGERVFDERRSLLFKMLQRALLRQAAQRAGLCAYSDRVIEGSPKNSISSVPIMSRPAP
jgi:CreA protein